jgi:nitrile hydratase accessory protein
LNGSKALLSSSEGLPVNAADEPVFTAPWQASAFALAVHLNESGLFTWGEWADTLSGALAGQSAEGGAEEYYRCWLAALQTLVERKGVATDERVGDLTAAWQRAAHATPHGKPILIENDPLYARNGRANA